ncbi:MAG: hypothetical protein Q7S84_03625 [bacterium]|nr:hypothetical protein [bacterium]
MKMISMNPEKSSARNLPKSGELDIERALERTRLMPETARVTLATVREFVPKGPVATLDYTIADSAGVPSVERWNRTEGRDGTLLGFSYTDGGETILNFDHHSRAREFERRVSTTNLVSQFLREGNVVEGVPLIHHTDCDSVLASLLASGGAESNELFDNAAIAADHTGARNEIADLLQALGPFRDYTRSLYALNALLHGEQLDGETRARVEKRQRDRAQVAALPFETFAHRVVLAHIKDRVDGELAPAAFPRAAVILLARPMPDVSNRWEIKVRAGLAFPEGRSLHELSLDAYGGRWNAGSTKRSGGTALTPEHYAELVSRQIEEVFGNQRA